VLVPLVERPAGLSLVLTRRTAHLRDHPGQVSFPGGRLEPGDEGPIATAVRETVEEIGVEARHIDVVGFLPPHAVITGFVVNPVVGFLDTAARFHPDSHEVAEVFEVPLDFFRDPATVQVGRREVRGLSLTVYTWHYEGRQIWGATAQMIRSFCERLNES
jgi:8-oxo-dGTP pyrophosphatase MutT (NUDIX family)